MKKLIMLFILVLAGCSATKQMGEKACVNNGGLKVVSKTIATCNDGSTIMIKGIEELK